METGHFYLQTYNRAQDLLGIGNSSLAKSGAFLCLTKALLSSIQTQTPSKKQNSIIHLRNHFSDSVEERLRIECFIMRGDPQLG